MDADRVSARYVTAASQHLRIGRPVPRFADFAMNVGGVGLGLSGGGLLSLMLFKELDFATQNGWWFVLAVFVSTSLYTAGVVTRLVSR